MQHRVRINSNDATTTQAGRHRFCDYSAAVSDVFFGFRRAPPGCWHDWKSQTILFGGDPRGTAISRSDLNPPHPDVYVRERSVQNTLAYSLFSSVLGELASPYPSTGLRESAVPPPRGESLLRCVKLFLLLAPKVASLAALGLCSAASTPLLAVLGSVFC